MASSGYLNLSHARLEYIWLGPRSERTPTVVMLHEGLGCVALWRDFPQRLSEATGLGVVAYSRQGYGRSSPITLPRPIDYMENAGCHELRAVLDTLGLERVLLLGHSDGASIALSYAGSARDSRLHAVIAMAPHVFAEARCREAVHATRQRFEQQALRQRLARYHGDNVDGAFYGWSDTWLDPAFASWDITPSLNGITAPVLLLQGSSDEYASDRHVRLVERHAHGLRRVVMLDGCGHVPHVERRDETLAAITAFIHDTGH